jgi:NAD(P)-dependent dehydrogenase (short-subunit alcohol dehydrogenase family)
MTETKVFLVTGATGNVGAALIGVLAARGLRTVALVRPGETQPAATLTVAADDLADAASAEAAVAEAATQLGRIDGLAHTVGGFAMAAMGESPPALWERMFRINALTTVNMVRAVLPHLRAAGGGAMVAIGAGAALRAPSGMAAYAASKAAVLRLVESTADETKRDNIRVNAVLPGTIDTPQNRAAMPDADPSHWTTPREVAETIAFLLSDAASGITGAAVPVPGRA